jgi:hypothetical protein
MFTTGSSRPDHKPRATPTGKDKEMKIAMFFARPSKPRRKSTQRSTFIEVSTTWTTRDWADLPVHHPRRD